jgi:hypothetical protein
LPEDNGISSGDPRVDAALKRLQQRNDARFRDLEDAMVVQAHLEKRMSERIKEHAELIAEHQVRLRDHAAFLARHEEFMKRHEIVMNEIEGKLNLMIEREMRREGGPETKS